MAHMIKIHAYKRVFLLFEPMIGKELCKIVLVQQQVD